MIKLRKRHFWDWFKLHHHEYLELNKKTKKEAAYWLDELTAHFRAYFKFFEYRLTWQDEQACTLTVSVDGKAVHFKKVDAFVALAPSIPGWEFNSLEDPEPLNLFLEEELENLGMDPEELFFSLEYDDPEQPTIIVYHPLCTEVNNGSFLRLAKRAVYNVLGERSFGTDVGNVEVANLSRAESGSLQKMEALPACIGKIRSSMTVDGNGKLLNM